MTDLSQMRFTNPFRTPSNTTKRTVTPPCISLDYFRKYTYLVRAVLRSLPSTTPSTMLCDERTRLQQSLEPYDAASVPPLAVSASRGSPSRRAFLCASLSAFAAFAVVSSTVAFASGRGLVASLGAFSSSGALGQGVMTDPSASREVTFTIDVACPPDWYKDEHRDFFDAGIARVQLVLRSRSQPPPFEFNRELAGYEGLWEELERVGDTKTFTGTKLVDNTVEYGFVLINRRGQELWEIGGANVRPALMGASCSSDTHAGGNVYHNRLMADTPANTTITTIFGGCQPECPIPCKVIALSDEPGDNIYSVLERDRDEVWRKAEGHMIDVAAGYDDLWALDGSGVAKYTHISALNETGSGWTNPSMPAAPTTIDIGLEEAYTIASSGAYWSKPADGSGSWNRLPGLIRQVGVGKTWMWAVVQDKSWVWACELPCSGSGVHHRLPGTAKPRACEVGLDWAFCVNEADEVYRRSAAVDWIDEATGTRWRYPSHLPSPDVWTRIPSIAAKQVTVGEEYLWAIDTRGIIRFCELPCDDGQWRRPSGVPAGITYIDASKFVSRV